MDTQKIGKRIRFLRGQESRDVFSSYFGIHRNTLAAWEAGERLPSLEFLTALAQQKGLSVAEVLGENELFTKRPNQEPSNNVLVHSLDDSKDSQQKVVNDLCIPSLGGGEDKDFTLIPLVAAVLSAGGGSFETADRIEGHYAFRNDFLTSRGNPKKMKLFRVDGDSMEPRVSDGDIALIDQGQISPRAGKIYAVRLEDVIYLKIFNAQPGRLILSSYNSAYAPIEFDVREDMVECFSIIGRAIWIGRELN